jgi:hypothetical protein
MLRVQSTSMAERRRTGGHTRARQREAASRQRGTQELAQREMDLVLGGRAIWSRQELDSQRPANKRPRARPEVVLFCPLLHVPPARL